MAFPTMDPLAAFQAGTQFTSGGQKVDAFAAPVIPGVNGFGTRQSSIPDQRMARSTRKLMRWLIPEGPIIQMYINPQNVTISNKKDISHQRTKGGYVLQYWGEGLTTISLQGTTGTSGIEGINVLGDVYRSEQLAFDPYALFLAKKNYQDSFSGDVFGTNSALGADNFVGALMGAAQEAGPQAGQNAPSLASFAFTVELYWSGEVYRGFFTDFNVTESANELGFFNYTLTFLATQKRGMRQNFLAWHRSATSGPSGYAQYSFGNLSADNLMPGGGDRSLNTSEDVLSGIQKSLGF